MIDILDYVEVVVPPAYSCDEFEVLMSSPPSTSPR